MKFIFVGAQGTGKTSVMDALPDLLPKVRGVTRKVVEDKNLTINKYSNNCTQKHIFDAYERELSTDSSYIAERGLIDVYAYTFNQVIEGKCSPTLMETQASHIEKFHKKYKDVIYFYFPIEFDIVGDGTRSVDKEYQKNIDGIIQTSLLAFNCNYYKVTGSVEERVKYITEIIKNNL